ncbi:YlbF family regulator [Lentibacillus cibarius]|uniref:YlbF family regulator n=1 Tax=Lentibacillus cibarius TaxID=2583219 RepID=A0A549YK80_9BACI|nr:YlbF family regulator [Lentibacillus cibarius]TRM12290.1 YlbF family regulator [Lentibacillus cibarius]
MIGTMEYADILDRSEQLSKMILQSDVLKAYQQARKSMEEDKEAQQLIGAFNDIKEQYEEVQRFGWYHPDYKEIMKKVRTSKREMDMNDKVAAFKVAERNLQKMLDEVSEYIAFSVSDQIKAPKDGAALTDTGCGHGGACGCSA